MIKYIMCSKIAAPTGRALAAEISERQGSRCVIRFKAMPLATGWGGKHIRYGSHVESPGECLNSLESVKLASDKVKALYAFECAGVPSPRRWFADNIAGGGETALIWRKNARHSANDNPYIVRANETTDRGRQLLYDYCLEFIDKRNEYRATSLLGRAIRLQKKVPKEGCTPDMDVRSNSRGWQLKDVEFTQSGRVSGLGIAAIGALGLDFGAADIIESLDGVLYVIEVNTAPGLTGRGIRRYSRHFHKWGQNNAE